jgi:hypothetical protein
MELKDTVPLLSALVGGVVGAAMNSLLNKRKTAAEIKKITAETDKIVAETAILSTRMEGVQSGQRQQEDQLSNIQRFLVRHFLTEPERQHLERLATAQDWPFQRDDTTQFFLNELKNLRALGLIEGRPNKGTRTLLREGGNVNSHFKIRPEGKEYLGLLKDVDLG